MPGVVDDRCDEVACIILATSYPVLRMRGHRMDPLRDRLRRHGQSSREILFAAVVRTRGTIARPGERHSPHRPVADRIRGLAHPRIRTVGLDPVRSDPLPPGILHQSSEIMISSSPLFRRALWHANRTPVSRVSKAVLSALHRDELARRRAAARALSIPDVVAARSSELARNGYAALGDLLDPALLAALDTASAVCMARAKERESQQAATHKSFWVRLLDAEAEGGSFDVDNVFVRFALQPAVIAFVASYLGELPRLTDVLLTYSKPTSADLSYSQLWHRDYDDIHTVKVFVYLTDVLEFGDGPFTFLPGPSSDRVGFMLRSHQRDDAFLARTEPSAVKEMRGPRLTAFACETSRCVHMGSRVQPGHARLMYTATFVTAPSLYPAAPPRFRASRPLSSDERLLLGL